MWAILLLLAFDTVLVDDFGAVGDGITDDHAAIVAAVNSAGPGGTVLFSPQTSYACGDTITPLAGQVFNGQGAVLVRPPAIVSVIMAPVVQGQDTVEVKDASQFEVGMNVTPVSSSGCESGNRIISAINGNVISLNQGLANSYSAGDVLVNHFTQISATNRIPVTICELTIEGNRASTPIVDWKKNRAILIYENCFVENCDFRNLPGDGVACFGGASEIYGCSFINTNTAAIHLSNDGTEDADTLIHHNCFVATNQRAAEAGHSEGVITISLRNNHLRVYQNFAMDCPRWFIGQFHVDMRDWTVSDNLVVNCDGLFSSKQNNNGPNSLRDLEFRHNVTLNSGLSKIHVLRTSENIQVNENVFVNSPVELEDITGLVVWANTFIHDPIEDALTIIDCPDVLESENLFLLEK